MDGTFNENIHPCKGCDDFNPPDGCKSDDDCGSSSDELIRKEDALLCLTGVFPLNDDGTIDVKPEVLIERFIRRIRSLQPVMQKTGKWIHKKYREFLPMDVWAEYSPQDGDEFNDEDGSVAAYKYVCSSCGKDAFGTFNDILSDYCPHCGVKMIGRCEDAAID